MLRSGGRAHIHQDGEEGSWREVGVGVLFSLSLALPFAGEPPQAPASLWLLVRVQGKKVFQLGVGVYEFFI